MEWVLKDVEQSATDPRCRPALLKRILVTSMGYAGACNLSKHRAHVR